MSENTVRIGQLVSSIQGRDSGRFYLITGIENETMVNVADGEGRKVENPKRKNCKHLILYGAVAGYMLEKVQFGKKITNTDVRKELKSLVSQLPTP
jgi:ribosomal protein L14E/L6E/L27E